ncbi:MAG: hypothetical protein AB4042_12300 [Leptolyngbyaceae cyanobacterium]
MESRPQPQPAIAPTLAEAPDILPTVRATPPCLPQSLPPLPQSLPPLPQPVPNLSLFHYAIWHLAHSTDNYTTGRGLLALGTACGYNERYLLAHYYCAIAADVFRGLRAQTDEADALYYAGVAAYQCDRPETATLLLERSRVLNLVTNRMACEARTLLKLGEIYAQLDQGKAALCCLLDGWTLYSEVGDRLGEMLTLVRLAWIHEIEDMPLSALDSYRQAIALYLGMAPVLFEDFSCALFSEDNSYQVGDRILDELMLKMADVLYQAGEINEALVCYRQVVWCHNQ